MDQDQQPQPPTKFTSHVLTKLRHLQRHYRGRAIQWSREWRRIHLLRKTLTPRGPSALSWDLLAEAAYRETALNNEEAGQ